jgi:ATP-binding cassette subfamily F protein 3
MISINNLSVQFTGTNLFDNVSFNINDKDRIGLVGKNGAGKSTLLKIIAGLQQPETGTIVVAKDQTIGYLPQEMIPNSSRTIIDEALTAFEQIDLLEQDLNNLTNEIANRTDYESRDYEALLNKHHEINERIMLLGGNNRREQTEKVLLGLGFQHSDFDRPITQFSGGWQMRVELAKILLKRPNFVLLDEPTNHLDIESIQWLETFLASYPGAVILVSHDRTFLDNITKRTIEITAGKIYDYKANYSEYVVQMEERRSSQLSALSNQQKEIAQIQSFIERFRYKATKAKQVQSRVKMLEKMEKINVDEVSTESIHFQFPPAPHSGKVVVEAENLSKAYDDKEILHNLNFIISKGSKTAFVGKNGEGKSTLAKIIIGEITDHTGVFKLGHQVKIGYFAQNQAALLDGELTVFQTIDNVAVGDIRTQIRNILGAFMFGGEASEKKVKVLSGGERSRLAMIRLLLEPCNLLILDEPTNHLDMQSKDVLKAALKEFNGTVICVSHDRDFLDGLVDKVYEFGGGKVKEHLGGIYDFLRSKRIDSLQELERKNQEVKGERLEVKGEVTSAKLDYAAQKAAAAARRKKEKQIADIEAAIAKLEQEQQDIEALLADVAHQTSENFQRYDHIKREMEQRLYEWEILSEEE